MNETYGCQRCGELEREVVRLTIELHHTTQQIKVAAEAYRRMEELLEAAEEVVSWVPSASLREPIPVAKRKGNLAWARSPLNRMCMAYDRWREVKGEG